MFKLLPDTKYKHISSSFFIGIYVSFLIEFKFEFDCCHRFRHEPDQESIRGCGVFPVYPSELGLKLFGSSSKEIFELEIITQISDNESQSRAIGNGVGGSNTEN